MTESEFRALAARGYNRIPLVLETFADLDTPLSVYLKLAAAPYTYLLESVQGGERFGRYSFIGLPAQHRIEVRGRQCTEFRDSAIVQRRELDDPLEFVATFRDRFKPFLPEELPRFCGGLVGYFGYDCVRYFESGYIGNNAQKQYGSVLMNQPRLPTDPNNPEDYRRCDETYAEVQKKAFAFMTFLLVHLVRFHI